MHDFYDFTMVISYQRIVYRFFASVLSDAEINQLQWCSSHEDWVGIGFENSVQFLKI